MPKGNELLAASASGREKLSQHKLLPSARVGLALLKDQDLKVREVCQWEHLFFIFCSPLPCSCFQMEINPVMIFNCMDARAARRIKQKTANYVCGSCSCVQLVGGDHKALLPGSGEYRVFLYSRPLLCFLLVSLIDSIGNQAHSQGPSPLSYLLFPRYLLINQPVIRLL